MTIRQELAIDDVLSEGPINVFGVNVDCHVTVALARDHEHAAIEIESVDLRSMHVVTDVGNVPLEADVMYQNKLFYEAFVKAVEAEAKKQAANSYDWTVVEYAV